MLCLLRMETLRYRNGTVLAQGHTVGKWNRLPGSLSGGPSCFIKLYLYCLDPHKHSLSSRSPVTEQQVHFSSESAIKAALSVERQLQRLLFSRLRQRLEANVSSPRLLTAGVDDEWAA